MSRFKGVRRDLSHSIEMTFGKGVPGAQRDRAGGRRWYQGVGHYAQDDGTPYVDPMNPNIPTTDQQLPAAGAAFVNALFAPPASGTLPASRDDLIPQDPIQQAQGALTDVLESTPSNWTVYFLRPAIGGAAVFAQNFPMWLRIPAAIWGLWPIWQTLRK
jgi:hypothetical protein